MRFFAATVFCVTFAFSSLFAADFTVASFNCGGLSDHYDYISAACMAKLMQERHNAEPRAMSLLDKIQQVALQRLFSLDVDERQAAEQEWAYGNYSSRLDQLTRHPSLPNSQNKAWRKKSERMISPYNKRPIILDDEKVIAMLEDHVKELTSGQGVALDPGATMKEGLDITRRVMAQRLFQQQLRYDIIALQEADYLDTSVFPDHYDTAFSKAHRLMNGVAWDKGRFALEMIIGDLAGAKGFAVKLRDLETGQTVVIVAGHLSGCNPFQVMTDTATSAKDSDKGDHELNKILERLDTVEADLKIIAMDANVTATHPRLSQLKERGYTLDYANFIEPTCTNPWQVLDARLDWIAIKPSVPVASIVNIPVLEVGLHSPRTNISDHKPIAARITY